MPIDPNMVQWDDGPQRPVNNPGNMRPPGKSVGFQQFPTVDAGLGAIDRQLKVYGDRGINTLEGVISTWSPPNENDTGRLVSQAAARLGIGPTDKLNLSDPAVRSRVREAIIAQEGNTAMVSKRIDPEAVRWDTKEPYFGLDPLMAQNRSPDSPFVAGGVKGAVGGLLRGLRDPIDAGAQMLVRGAAAIGLAPESEVQRVDAMNRAAEQDYRQNWRGGQDIGFDAARLTGGILGTAPLAAAAPAGATLGLAGRTALGGAAGAGFGALQPVDAAEGQDFWTEKAKQAGIGAAAGGVGALGTAGLARIVSPKSSANVQKLISEGVTPTPGQVLGGVARRSEEALSSVPILGAAIRAGEHRAVEQLNRVAINRALAPIGKTLPRNLSGRDAISFAQAELGKSYDDVLNRVGPVGLDSKLQQDVVGALGKLSVVPKEKAQQFVNIVQQEVIDRAQNGLLNGRAIKDAESNLGRKAADYLRSADPDQRALGDAIGDAQTALRQWLERVAPPDVSDQLKAANAGWAAFKRVQRASTALGAEEGVFTAAQLQNAIKALDRSKDKAQFGRGSALMQDLSEAGKAVLGSRVPNSGTPERAMLSGLLLGGAYVSPQMAAAPIAGSLAYTPWGQRAMASLLAGRQQAPFKAASEGLLTLTPALGAALAPSAYGLLQ